MDEVLFPVKRKPGRPRKTEESMKREEQDLFTYQADEVAEVLSTLPSKDKKICLYRVKPQGTVAYITEFFPEEFTQEWIKEKYGGGKFSIVADTNDGPKKMRFEIEGDPKIEGATRLVRKIGPNGSQYLVSMTDKELIDQAVRQQEATPADNKPVATANDPTITLLLNQISRLESRLESLQNANPASSRLDFYKEMAVLKELFAQPPQQSQTGLAAQQIADIIKTGLQLGADAANGDIKGPSIWETLIEKALPVVTSAIATMQNRAVPVPSPIPVHINEKPLPNGGIADMLPSSMVEQKTEEKPVAGYASMLQPYIGLLIGSAATGGAPEPWAEIIISRIPVNEVPGVIIWLEGQSWFTDIAAMDGRIGLQQSWWFDLHDSLISMIKGEGEETGDTEEEADQ